MRKISLKVLLIALKIVARRPGTRSRRVTDFVQSVQTIVVTLRSGREDSLAYVLAERCLTLWPDNADLQQLKFEDGINSLLNDRGWIHQLLHDVVEFREVTPPLE